MSNTFRLYFGDVVPSDQKLLLASIVLITSVVYAEQNIPLDLTLDLDASNVTTILERDDWREPKKEEENGWRQKPAETKKNVRWGARSIYEEDQRLGPVLSDDNKPSGVVDMPEAAPKFKLRF